MASFVVGAKYEADSGEIHPIRISAPYYNAAGTPPSGNITSNIKVKSSKSNREHGIRPRGANLARVVGSEPDTFTKNAFLPILLASEFNTGDFIPGGTVTIDSVEWTIVSLKAEDY